MKEKLAFLFENWKTVPNLLSFIRILLIPVFAMLFYNEHNVAAVIVLAISGFSDLIDGKIARKYNQISNLGKMLDPIADKLTVFAIAIILFIKFWNAENDALHSFAWVFLLFIGKDVLMLVVGGIMIVLGMRPCAAEIYGKLATVIFYVGMVVIMAIGPEVGAFRNVYTLPDTAMMAIVIVAVVATFIAFISYIPDVIRQFGERYGLFKYKTKK